MQRSSSDDAILTQRLLPVGLQQHRQPLVWWTAGVFGAALQHNSWRCSVDARLAPGRALCAIGQS